MSQLTDRFGRVTATARYPGQGDTIAGLSICACREACRRTGTLQWHRSWGQGSSSDFRTSVVDRPRPKRYLAVFVPNASCRVGVLAHENANGGEYARPTISLFREPSS